MRKIVLLFLLLVVYRGNAQDFLMNAEEVTTCSGNFYDSGGLDSNYSMNQNFVKTFYPGTEGSAIRFEFTSFSTEDQADILYVYDGNSITAPLIGGFTGATLPPVLKASGENTSGALTFRFISDGSTTMPGWAATISCEVPCQDIQSVLISTVPEADPNDGLIKVCPGTTVAFNGDAVFANSGEGATYVWTIDGVEIPGQNITYTFANGGAFPIKLRVTDANGCLSNNSLNSVVQTAVEPSVEFSVEGDSSNAFAIEANSITSTYTYDCTPEVAGETFLPDGSGVSYQSSISVDCYDADATLTSGDQLLSVCLNMEHSYLGDLEMTIIAPNGAAVTLENFISSPGYYLGDALDDESDNPGVGMDYCFSPTGTSLLQNGTLIPASDGVGEIVSPGTYKPYESFNSLIGTPLNGIWTIQVIDHQAIDNGYIFNWTIELDPALLPTSLSFDTNVTARGWMPNSDILDQTETSVVVGSPDPGQQCFTYFMTTDSGCTFYYDQCVELEALNTNSWSLSKTVILSPSPAQSSFGITGLDRFNASATQISITDVSGKLLRTFAPSESYDISGFETGLYFVRIWDGQASVVKRLIKS
jgi:subtilisin-like proprotein convertase family protein